MAAMTYLSRHPKTGVYYFRRAVPDDLRKIIGKTAIKQTLGTKDVSEATRQRAPPEHLPRARRATGGNPPAHRCGTPNGNMR